MSRRRTWRGKDEKEEDEDAPERSGGNEIYTNAGGPRATRMRPGRISPCGLFRLRLLGHSPRCTVRPSRRGQAGESWPASAETGRRFPPPAANGGLLPTLLQCHRQPTAPEHQGGSNQQQGVSRPCAASPPHNTAPSEEDASPSPEWGSGCCGA